MLKRRVIVVLYLLDGFMTRSEVFRIHQLLGHPIHHVERLVEWDVDELIVIDISTDTPKFDTDRDDYRYKGPKDLLGFIHQISSNCRIPLTFGGRIRTMEDIQLRIQNGADKVTLNAVLDESPDLVREAAEKFGSQAIVASIDFTRDGDTAEVVTHHATKRQGVTPVEWAKRAEKLGAGEIFLNAVDRDGKASGFDVDVIQSVVDAVSIPVIACGGAGHPRHFLACLEQTNVAAVAAGNTFHFTENAYPNLKTFLKSKRDDIR
ncbi:MAG: HisA/HisF-related TIM barrel protein [Rhodospirillales bacterium]